ncbi:MAG: Mth938-like domain-containing protein [Gammaproteobacteria bacterium]
MKIEIDLNVDSSNKIDAYSAGCVVIGKKAYKSSLIVSPGGIIENWPPDKFPDLTCRHMEQILSLSPEIVLLGTGLQLCFPADELLAPFASRKIGFEVMDTGAACRSYNFLLGEGRQVAAALLMIED